MASTFTFYRPHGVPRNYVVEITIEHSPADVIYVFVNHNRPENCGHCGHQHPTGVNGTGTSRKITYVIGDRDHPVPMVPGDTITIEVSVPKVVPKQTLVYTATDTGFTCEAQPFKLNNKQVWQPHEIAFQRITIIDRDKQEQALLPTAEEQPAAGDGFLHKHRVRLDPSMLYSQQEFPYLEKSTIKKVVREFAMADGTYNWDALEKALRQKNAEAEERAKQERQLTAQGLIRYSYLSQAFIESQVQRFTRSSGIVNELRLHEVLKEVNEAAKNASEQQVPLLQRQVEEILAHA